MMSHFPKNNLTYLLFLLCFAYALTYADAPDMKARFMTAGKASLYDPSYILTRTIDTAAFSPELQLPIQLVYQSNLQDEGGFGYGWRSPQLESLVSFDKDGLLWTTPWGERVHFSFQRKVNEQDSSTLAPQLLMNSKHILFSMPAEWIAVTDERDPTRTGTWTFFQKSSCRNWQFNYRNHRLDSIVSPATMHINFIYHNNHLVAIQQHGISFVELVWNDNRVECLKVNGIETKLSYHPQRMQLLPKTEQGIVQEVHPSFLASIRKANLLPESLFRMTHLMNLYSTLEMQMEVIGGSPLKLQHICQFP